jgi:hypothetical protein
MTYQFIPELLVCISGRFTSCLDVQQKLQAREDKEYTLQIMGINVSIYCHGMSTDSPQEYLSLPAGEDENFSEIYDRRYVYMERMKTANLALDMLSKYMVKVKFCFLYFTHSHVMFKCIVIIIYFYEITSHVFDS